MDSRSTLPHALNHFTGIQTLRIVAAMLVVAMHTSQTFLLRIAGTTGADYWSGGGAGVDLFFVISGFVMTLSTASIRHDRQARVHGAWVFMQRRFVRIAPIYWFYLLLKVALVLALPALALRTSIDPAHVAASFLFIPMMSPWGAMQPVLPVGWTLNFEMLFYAVFAAVIALGLPRVWFSLLALGIIFVAGRVFPDVAALSFYSQSLLFEFVLGMAVARVVMARPKAPAMASLALVAAGAVLMFLIDWGPDADRFSTWGIGAGLMVLGVVWLEPWIGASRLARKLSFLGDASYSIYLSHTFVVPAAVVLLKMAGIHDAARVMLAVCLVVMLVGCYAYMWLERPLTGWFKRAVLDAQARPVKGARSGEDPQVAPAESAAGGRR
jgi:peptidoglycan/LPS O-acetylase OafA/YrhL